MSEMTVEQVKEVLEKEKAYMLSHGGDVQHKALDMAIKALAENEKLKKSRNDFAEASSRYYAELQELKSQMSAVEVLEWLKENNHDEDVMTPLFGDMCICYALENLEPQEIVDKIQEYEKNNSNRNSNSGAGTQKGSEEPPKEEPQVEWVWKVNCVSDHEIVESENEAIELCEEWALRYNENISYKKVCRRKG